MKIGILKEKSDTRVAMIPENVKKLIDLGNLIWIEKDAGRKASFSNELYQDAGANISNRKEIIHESDILLSICPPEDGILEKLNPQKILISLFEPYNCPEILEKIATKKLTAFSLDMIPRITLAQNMDILSSMASIAGYKAILIAANLIPIYFPMLSTSAGTIPPAKVLVLGAGIAGLQAIATAKRLGAVVEAFDTRLASKEEVQSLGAKFIEITGAIDDKSAGGYAVEQSEKYKKYQQNLIQEKAHKSDVIVATAQLRGKSAPLLITREAVESMPSGSVIIDLAASTGGNCVLTKNQETIVYKDVTIVGDSNLASRVPKNASQLFSRNLYNFMNLLLKSKAENFDMENQIISSSCIIERGKIRYKP